MLKVVFSALSALGYYTAAAFALDLLGFMLAGERQQAFMAGVQLIGLLLVSTLLLQEALKLHKAGK